MPDEPLQSVAEGPAPADAENVAPPSGAPEHAFGSVRRSSLRKPRDVSRDEEDAYASVDATAYMRRISDTMETAALRNYRVKGPRFSIGGASEARSGTTASAAMQSEFGLERLTMDQLRDRAKLGAAVAAEKLLSEPHELRDEAADGLRTSLRTQLKWDPVMAGMLAMVKVEQKAFKAALGIQGDAKLVQPDRNFEKRIGKKINLKDLNGPGLSGDAAGGGSSSPSGDPLDSGGRGRSRRVAPTASEIDAALQDCAPDELASAVGHAAAQEAKDHARRSSSASLGSGSGGATMRRTSSVMNPEVEQAIHKWQAKHQGSFRKRVSSTTLQRLTRAADMKVHGDLFQTSALAAPRNCILMPRSAVKVGWDLMMAVVVCYSVVMVPLLIAFVEEVPTWAVLNTLCDVLFISDIVVTFRTAYEDPLHGVMITSPPHIARRYLLSYFLLDATAAMPLELFLLASKPETEGGSQPSSDYSSYARFNKMLRLLRIFKLLRVLSMASESSGMGSTVSGAFNPSLINLLKLLFMMVLMWHWVACGYYYFAITASTDDPTYVSGAGVWMQHEHLHAPTIGMRYLFSLAWAVGITCQIALPEPENFTQQIYGTLVMMVSVVVIALVIGSATTLIADVQKERSEATLKLQAIDRLLRHKRLPATLRQRITSYCAFRYTSVRLDEAGVLADLPRSLKLQVDLVVHRAVFTRLSLFRDCRSEEIFLLVQRLTPSMAMPGEMLIAQNDIGVGIFFLMQGAVEVMNHKEDSRAEESDTNELVSVMLAVCAFGERALSRMPAKASVRALRFCEISVLLTDDFDAICELNPLLRQHLDSYVFGRDQMYADRAGATSSSWSGQRNGDASLRSSERSSVRTSVASIATVVVKSKAHRQQRRMSNFARGMKDDGQCMASPSASPSTAEESFQASPPAGAADAPGSSTTDAMIRRQRLHRARTVAAFNGKGWLSDVVRF